MSQRECAGFNWPPLSIPASEPVSISPEAVSRAGPTVCASTCSDVIAVRLAPVPSLSPMRCFIARCASGDFPSSFATGVGQPAKSTTSFSVTCTLRPSGVLPSAVVPSGGFCPPLGVVGVGHPASSTVLRLLSLFPAALLPFCAGVPAIGVGHPANNAQWSRMSCRFLPSALVSVFSVAPFQSRVVAVGHPASAASAGNAFWPTERPDVSCACGVVQPFSNPPEPLSDVRRPDARSAEINRPAGVARSFQVSVYKVEPTEAVLARNLLAKDDWRAALANEVEEGRPEVPLVSKPCAFACRAERLARATAGPDGAVIGPTGAAQGVGPDANAGEEVALSKPGKVSCNDILDAPFIHMAVGDVPATDQFAQPRRGLGVDLVVVGSHAARLRTASTISLSRIAARVTAASRAMASASCAAR